MIYYPSLFYHIVFCPSNREGAHHLGTPIRLLGEEQSGTPLAYDEFGVPLVESGLNQNNPFGFTGYQADEVSGLY